MTSADDNRAWEIFVRVVVEDVSTSGTTLADADQLSDYAEYAIKAAQAFENALSNA